jgi:hypothetical protein
MDRISMVVWVTNELGIKSIPVSYHLATRMESKNTIAVMANPM